MELVYILLVLLAGACAPTQAGINSQLSLWTHDPVLASLISFAVGTVALAFLVFVLRIQWPPINTALGLPWWQWTGGFLGAFLVVVTVFLAPKLGAATMIAFFVAGQMFGSLLLDHFGWVGYDTHPVNVWRLAGAAFLITGVVMIEKF
ncbi:MAG: DMT family transporter [Desulfomonile tiedjei]|uniref:DMT family transporter n=1 Tax=Desulfomonile tiedjei TaxID=2358 RepID=A0A9D6Z6W7_9BACT|nr:DMT family transporter [Desulfomonile tiedjei]